MHVTLVHVHVKPDVIEAFIDATIANHEHSVHEAGNLRFDVLQDPQEPTHFILYEAYRNETAAKAHKETAHYLLWRDTVADMMAQPREGVAMVGLRP